MQRKRPTIADVARTAGVSIGTVSNFINGTAALREDTRDRIEKAVAALMYRPSSFARSLPGRAPRRPKNLDHLPSLLVAGRVSVDFLCRVDVLPHRDDRITASHIEKALGGPAANLAVAAAGVGAPYAHDVELATAVGRDAESGLPRTRTPETFAQMVRRAARGRAPRLSARRLLLPLYGIPIPTDRYCSGRQLRPLAILADKVDICRERSAGISR